MGSARFGQDELVFPAIAHVIGVAELCDAWPEQLLNGRRAARLLPMRSRPEVNSPQMRILPLHGGLNDCMELDGRWRAVKAEVCGVKTPTSPEPDETPHAP